MVRVCFVCLGNICRSPTAEGVFRHLLRRRGLAGAIEVDSAGTSAYHVGEPPDARATAAAARRGIRLSGRARQFKPEDFARFDYVVAMDRANLRRLREMARRAGALDKVFLFRDLDPDSPEGADVPDPYYGGPDGFEEVLDIVEAGAEGLLAHILRQHPEIAGEAAR